MKNTVDMPVGVDIQGNLIAPDLTTEFLAGEVKGQAPEDFGLAEGDKLASEIATVWGDAKVYWGAFQRALSRLRENDPARTVTRKQWVVPLLKRLGYDPAYVAKAEIVDGQTYAITHRAEPGENKPPIHIIGCRVRLEQRPPIGTLRLSAHALVQEYLNRTEHLWSVVTNGLRWRLLRDSTLMTRLTYVEFDLEQILNGENFAEFGLFYRLFHRSRLPKGMDDADECLLEFYHQESLQQGGRVRDQLRDGVEAALRILGTGFLQHPQGQNLREKFEAGTLTEVAYYRQLLMLIYRLLLLMVAESRDLLLSADDPEKARIYMEYYSIARLRALAEQRPSWRREGFQDLWQGLWITFQLFDENWRGQALGLSPLGGDLFDSHTLSDLSGCAIDNYDLMQAICQLSLYRDEKKDQLRRVNYKVLDIEELGSVYESLLECHPQISQQKGIWEFRLVIGTERKTAGSYYTPPELVEQLIKNVLKPVIAERLKSLGVNATVEAKEQAILRLKICDPACGSGHFLLAAARHIGKELARIRTSEIQPEPESLQYSIRTVIQHCIYGVDLNPLAVDLSKVALWLEGLCRGLSLDFLDHRIKCGNSLVGVLDLDRLKQGIPDGAYKSLSGDDSILAIQLKKRNEQERENADKEQWTLQLKQVWRQDWENYATTWREIENMKGDNPAEIRQKKSKYERSRYSVSWLRDFSACNLWTAAFLMPLTKQNFHLLPTSATIKSLLKGNWANQAVVDAANQLAEEKKFFHWPLEYPEVFEQGGFDCLLGNPPLELIKFQERKFFEAKAPEIANEKNKFTRVKLIEELANKNLCLFNEFKEIKHETEAKIKFIKESNRYPLTSGGGINTYSMFTETGRNVVLTSGRLGLIPAQISFANFQDSKLISCVIASLNTLVFDFASRKNLTETDFDFAILKKFPVIPPKVYSRADIDFIAPRVTKLIYTFWGKQPWDQGLSFGNELPTGQLEQRMFLNAELDAYYAHLYGLARDELCYILNTSTVDNFNLPGIAFHAFNGKEFNVTKQLGKYNVQRRVLEVWDKLFDENNGLN